MENRPAVPNGDPIYGSFRRCFHRCCRWPDGQCVCLSQCDAVARKIGLVFKSLLGPCHTLRSRNVGWLSLYSTFGQALRTSTTQQDRIPYGLAGYPGRIGRGHGPKAMETSPELVAAALSAAASSWAGAVKAAAIKSTAWFEAMSVRIVKVFEAVRSRAIAPIEIG